MGLNPQGQAMGHSVAPAVVRGYRDLLVWRRSVDLVLEIYDATAEVGRMLAGLTRSLKRLHRRPPSDT